MKTTVTKYLNVRAGSPSLNAPCHSYLVPGSELITDGKLYTGDLYKGINTWLKDDGGNFYWSGGVNNPLPWWISDFGIDEIWNYSRGEGTAVILLDSGFTECEDVGRGSLLIENAEADTYGHGTTMSCIICGKGPTIIGVAPNCKLIHIKISNGSTIENSDFIKGLSQIKEIIKKAPELRYIVNCSLTIKSATSEQQEKITQLIQELTDSHVIFTAAAGNNSSDIATFLESLDTCVISSAGINKRENDLYLRVDRSNIWDGINITTPGYYPSLKPFSIGKSGSSHSCAYTSGLISLLLSIKPQLDIENIKSLIEKFIVSSIDINSGPGFKITNKIISRGQLLQTVKNLKSS